MTVNRQYFTDLFRDRGLSQREIGRRLGLSSSQMARTLDGNRRLQLGEALELAQMLGITLHEIMLNAGISDRHQAMLMVPVVGILNGNGEIAAIEEGTAEMTPSPGDLTSESVAIQARTVGTPLDWADAWVFFCQAQPQKPDPSSLGRLCVVKIEGGPEVLATVRRGYKPNTYNLSGFTTADSQAVEWLRPVLITRHP